jgi:ribosome maturation factor RimP
MNKKEKKEHLLKNIGNTINFTSNDNIIGKRAGSGILKKIENNTVFITDKSGIELKIDIENINI